MIGIHWVLIAILSWSIGDVAPATVVHEFNTKAACDFAAQELVKVHQSAGGGRVAVTCVPQTGQ